MHLCAVRAWAAAKRIVCGVIFLRFVALCMILEVPLLCWVSQVQLDYRAGRSTNLMYQRPDISAKFSPIIH